MFETLILLGNPTFEVKADNCIYAGGNWIGDELIEGGSPCGGDCRVHNIQWKIEDFSGDGSNLVLTRYYIATIKCIHFFDIS